MSAAPATSAPPESLDGWLLESRLTPPPPPSPAVSRTGLVNRLRAAAEPVVLIVAPAGYGKTTLLTQWIERDARPAAWLTLDSGTDDPETFAVSLAAAIDDAPAFDTDAFDTVGLHGLGARLSALEEPMIVVLDDVSAIHNRDCLRAIMSVAEHLPPGSILALAGRREPEIAIARLRARGRLLELGPEDLAMSGHEGRALLRTAGADVSDHDAAHLTRTTEGWAAGLQLAARALQANPAGSASTVAAFGGDDRFLADYFRLEVLSGLSDTELEFLSRTSVLESLCGPLCDTILDRTDSADTLERLERCHVFLSALDRGRVWYRYHPLFRDALRAELEKREPGAAAGLSARSAEWCESHEMSEAAIDYAQKAGDAERAGRLIGALAHTALHRGRIDTVERWITWFEHDDRLDDQRAVAVVGAWVHAMHGKPLQTRRWTDVAEYAPRPTPNLHGAVLDEPEFTALRALQCRDGVERMRLDSELSVERLAPRSPWQPAALTLLGISFLLAGDNERAGAMLGRALERSTMLDTALFASLALAEQALLSMARGDYHAAETLADEAYEVVRSRGLEDYATSALIFATAARVGLRQGDSARARDALERAERGAGYLSSAIPWLSIQTNLELVSVRLALADVPGAMATLADAESALRERPDLIGPLENAGALRRQLDAMPAPSARWASGLTGAELRLLPLLATHLSFREIAERLFLSRNTVKTQAISVYRKLGVCCRSDAIARADALGLIEIGPA